jgi:hypothetical protein
MLPATARSTRSTGSLMGGRSPIKSPLAPEAVVRRNAKRGLTIEQMFADPAPPPFASHRLQAAAEAGRLDGEGLPVDSGGGGEAEPFAKAVLLTPRSAEACLKEGVNPDDLRLRDLDWFWEPGLDPAIQRMRHETYSRLRHEKMKAVRKARATIIAERRTSDKSKSFAGRRGSLSSSRSGGGSSTRSAAVGADLVELERKRLAKMQAKQAREIEQTLAFEMKMAEIREKQAQREEAERRRQEARRIQKERRAREAAEAERMKAVRKQMAEEEEEKLRRDMMRRDFERQQELLEEARIKERQAKLEAARKEEERIEKQARFREEIEVREAQKAAEIQSRMMVIEEREAERRQRVEEEQAQRAREKHRRQEAASRRLRENARQARLREKKRVRELLEKEKAVEARQHERRVKEEAEREAKIEAARLEELRRQAALAKAREEEEEKKQLLIAKAEDEEKVLGSMEADKQREHMLRIEKRRLQEQAKADAVTRQKRREEYERLETLRKIQDKAEKIEMMQEEQKRLREERRRIALATQRQKDQVMRAMEEAKRKGDWKAARAIIEKSLTVGSSSAPTLPGGGRPSSSSLARRAHEDDGLAEAESSHAKEAARFTAKAAIMAQTTMTASASKSRIADAGKRSLAPTPSVGADAPLYKSPYDV